MAITVRCWCGNIFDVRPADANSFKRCPNKECGTWIAIPRAEILESLLGRTVSLEELEAASRSPEARDARRPAPEDQRRQEQAPFDHYPECGKPADKRGRRSVLLTLGAICLAVAFLVLAMEASKEPEKRRQEQEEQRYKEAVQTFDAAAHEATEEMGLLVARAKATWRYTGGKAGRALLAEQFERFITTLETALDRFKGAPVPSSRAAFHELNVTTFEAMNLECRNMAAAVRAGDEVAMDRADLGMRLIVETFRIRGRALVGEAQGQHR